MGPPRSSRGATKTDDETQLVTPDVDQLTSTLQQLSGSLSSIEHRMASFEDLALRQKQTVDQLADASPMGTPCKLQANPNTIGRTALLFGESNSQQQDRVAIIGYSCILPGGENVTEAWEMIQAGIDNITDIPPDRVDVSAYFHPDKTVPDKIYCTRGGFIPSFDFDPREFNFNMLQMEDTDTNQTLSLLKVKEALEDAKIDPSPSTKKNIGCVLGIGGGQKASNEFYSRLNYVVVEKVLRGMGMPEKDVEKAVEKYKSHFPLWRLDSFPGFLGNVTAGRVCNVFNLDGMNCVVDAACASSLISVKVAMEELLHGDCDTMIAGATCTDCSIGMYMAFSKTPVFSTKPQVTAYDKDAKGMLIGEGSVIYVLKRLASAVRDGNVIHAVIRSCSSSSDGKAPGIYAPTVEGQELAIRRAYQHAGIDPSTVTLVEGHGTGTPVGDAIELTALKNVLGEGPAREADPRRERVAVGSIKSNIGHLKAVAGAAGMLKVILALKHKVLPKTINVKEPPVLRDGSRIQDTAIFINTRNRPWFTKPGLPRRAGVSSFGFGGSNYHCVLEENESEHTGPYRVHSTPDLLLVAAPSVGELIQVCETALSELSSASEKMMASGDKSAFSYEAQMMEHVYYKFVKANHLGRELPMNYPRVGFVCSSAKAAIAILEAVISRLRSKSGQSKWSLPKQGAHFRVSGRATKGKTAAIFSGQGSQYTYMFDDVAMNWPPMRKAISEMDAASIKARPEGTLLVSETLYPRQHYESEPEPDHDNFMQDTLHAQPCTTAVAVGAYDVFVQAGFKPDFLAGHSLGEIAALYAGGIMDRATAFELVCHRATAMSEASKAAKDEAMAAIIGPNACDIQLRGTSVWLANVNEPSQVVISGAKAAVHAESENLTKSGYRVVPLRVSGAFHTPLMQNACSKFEKCVLKASAAFKSPEARVYSNVTGEHSYNGDAVAIANLLSKHIVSSVRWMEQIRAMHRDGARVFVEFGPRATLAKFVEKILPGDDVCTVSVNASKDSSSDTQLRDAAVQLAVIGVPLTNFDPWGVVNTFKLGRDPSIPPQKKSKGTIKLSAATFVAPRTKRALESAMSDGYKISGNIVSNSSPSVAALKAKDHELQNLAKEAHEAKETVAHLKSELAAAEARADAAIAEAQDARNTVLTKPTAIVTVEPISKAAHLKVDLAAAEAKSSTRVRPDSSVQDALSAAPEVDLTFASTREIPLSQRLGLTYSKSRPVLLVDDGSAFTAELARQLSAIPNCAVVVLAFSKVAPCPLPSPVKRRVLLDRSEEGLERIFAELQPCGFIYQHADLDSTSEHCQLRWALLAAKHASRHFESLRSASSPTVRPFFVGVCRMGNNGHLGVANPSSPDSCNFSCSLEVSQRGAIFGLCKSLALEWPYTFCRGIDLDSGIPPVCAASLVVNELACPDLTLREVGYGASQRRFTTCAKLLSECSSATGRNPPSATDVWLVSGGGRGITPLCMASMARRLAGGTYILMGRSELADEPVWSCGVRDTGKPLEQAALNYLKAEFAAGRGAKPTPRAMNKLVGNVRGNREVRESIALVERAGGRAIYLACDTSEASKVAATLLAVKERYSLSVTGVVHAAGVLFDKKVENKTPADFDAVYGTKVTGLFNILSALGEDRRSLRHLVVFSSLAGFHGNTGQTDYSMANEALSKMVHNFGASNPKCSVRALCFGPWDGGMVTPQLKAHFKAQGVQIIPREGGAEQVAALICMPGRDRSQCLVGNWGLPPVVPLAPEQTVDFRMEAPLPNGKNCFVDSHVIQGRRVLPMTVTVGYIAATVVRMHPGYFLLRVQDAQLFSGIDLDSDVEATLTTRRLAEDSQGTTLLTIKCVLKKEVNGRLQPAYGASVVLSSTKPPSVPAVTVDSSISATELPPSQLYDGVTLFHGTFFQGLQGVTELTDTNLRARARHIPLSNEQAGQFDCSSSCCDGFSADIMLQCMLVWARHKYKKSSLPSRIGSLEWHRQIPKGSEFLVSLSIEKSDAQGAIGTCVFHDKSGMCYMIGRGLAIVLNDTLVYAAGHPATPSPHTSRLSDCSPAPRTGDQDAPHADPRIAVIGVACKYAGAPNLDAFWELLCANKSGIAAASAERLGIGNTAMHLSEGGNVGIGADAISNDNYGTLTGVSSEHELLLSLAREALIDAASPDISNTRCGIVSGCLSFPRDGMQRVLQSVYEQHIERELGGCASMIATAGAALPSSGASMSEAELAVHAEHAQLDPASYVAAKIGMSHGSPRLCVDAACASALYCMQLAQEYLVSHKVDMMLCGASCFPEPMFVLSGFSAFQALPPKRSGSPSVPFERETAGLTPGEGGAILVLKRLADAERDGDRIYGTLLGAHVTNAGTGLPLKPDLQSELDCLRATYEKFGIDPQSLQYVECHATGTPQGDACELQALRGVFGDKMPLLGSSKGNFGHTLVAAGFAGACKLLLAMRYGKIPATPNIKNCIDRHVVTRDQAWPQIQGGRPKRAGLSAFGFGGTNAHAVFEEYRRGATLPKPIPELTAAPVPLAIVGMAARFGTLNNLRDFERALYLGEDGSCELPPKRWRFLSNDSHFRSVLAAGESVRGCFIESVDVDYRRLRLPMLPEDELQPLHLLALSTIDKALIDSNITFEKGARVAVLVGLGTDMELYRHRARVALRERLGLKPQDELNAEQAALLAYVSDLSTATSYTSNIGNIIATRIASIWGFTGPAFTVTQGANSVFRCLELASAKLASSDIDAAVVAGVDLSGSAEALFTKKLHSIFSRTATDSFANETGASFEDSAASYFVGEGAGVLVLKRLADVPRSSSGECKERVYACIDAVTEAATVQDSIRQACEAANIEPSQVGYVELSADGSQAVDDDEIRGVIDGYRGSISSDDDSNASADRIRRTSTPPPPEQFGLLKNVVNAGMQLGSTVYNKIATSRTPAASAIASSKPSSEHATKVVLAVLAAKTGYEPEMIEMDMNLETELGVDSIKRVEILSEVQKELKVEAQNVAALSRTQTVSEVVEAMIQELGNSVAAPSSLSTDKTGLPPSERRAFQGRRVAVGTVKSSVGHTGYASGAAALIKTALCLHHRYLPKMPKWRQPKGHMRDAWEDSSLYICPESRAWVKNEGDSRYAAVSGVSCTAPGSKFHVVLSDAARCFEEYNVMSLDAVCPKMITLGSETYEGIKEAIAATREQLSKSRAEEVFASLLLSTVAAEREGKKFKYTFCLVTNVSQLSKELDLAATGIPSAIASGRDYTSPSGSFFAPRPLHSNKVAFMYGDGSSPYFGLGKDIHRIAPSLHKFVEQSTTAMWSLKHDNWNARGVLSEAMEEERASFDKRTVDMFRAGVYHSVCFTHVARDVMSIRPRAAFGLSMGEAAMFFAFEQSNSLKSDELLTRLDSSSVWTEQLSLRFEALRTAWGIPADAPISSFWVGYAIKCRRENVEHALRELGSSTNCVRLVIVNDADTCIIAGKPAQCQVLIAHLGCSAMQIEQGLAGHCKEVEPFVSEIARIHEPIQMPNGNVLAEVSFYSTTSTGVKLLESKPGASMGGHMAALYTVVADFPKLVRAVGQDGYNVFVELGAGDLRTSATKNVLGSSNAIPHVAVAMDRKGADTWRQVLKVAAALISNGETGCKVTNLYHPLMLSEMQECLNGSLVNKKVRKTVEVNGRFTGMMNSPTTIRKSHAKPDSRLLDILKRVPTSAIDLGELDHQAAQMGTPLMNDSGGGFGSKGSLLTREIEYQRAQAKKYKASGKPLLWDFDDLLQFAEGDIAPVFNKFPSGEHPPWELIDTYPKCCRLPQREYLLCSRVTKMDATTNKFEPCSMTTEYDLPYDGELSEGGQVPWAVLVESGQCDLMLISYLGIDFQNKGVRAYRLLDTTLTFYGVAQEGQTLCYDISIQSFAKQEGKVTMFFFSYNCYVDGKLLIEMRNGVAGFFTEAELDAGKGVVWTDGERAARAKAAANPKDPTPFLINPASKTYFSEVDMRTLSEKGHHDGTWGAVVGPSAASVKYKLCARKMLMIDRITHIIPRGGIHGLGMLIGEKILERDHWYFPCHFKNDQVMAGSLVSDGCSQLLKLYMIWMGLHTAVDGIVFTPVHKQANKVRCRGQISPHKGKLVYWVEINEIGFNTATGYPYAKADVNILDINFEKGETFDYPDNDSLLAALEAYGKGDMKRKIVVDFRGVALQIEGSPTSQHPNHRGSAPAARSSVVSGYDVGGLHLSGGFRSPLPPTKFMKWGGPTAGGHELSWHPMAGRDGNPTPGFRATAYPPRPICFLPFPGNPNDTNHTPGELPLSWVNMCEFMCNNLSACLGEEYKGFDESTSSRSPAFDLALTTRVLSVTGMVQEKGSTKWYGVDCDPSTGTMVAEFDCPSDAWFFVGAPRDDLMPYSILMEIALQTCGILTSWNKAPLTLAITHGYNLLFRNLDATATLIANVDLRGKTIVNTSKCTGYSMLGQMGVQKFNTVLQVDGQPFYEVDSSFGWFLPSVFEKQIGLDAGEKRECWHVLAGHAVQRYSLPDEEGHLFNEASLGSHTLQRRSNQVRFLDSVAFSATGGMHKQGYGHGCKKVDQRDWFFSCHFWCDPVMPGSLGIEAMHQTLELLCVKNGLTAGVRQPTFAHDLGKTTWKYRGQLTPKNDQCDVEVHVKSVVRANGCVTVVADGFLYVDHLRVYQANGLRLRIEPGEAPFVNDSGGGFGSKGSLLTREIEYQRAQAKKYKASGKPLLWDFDDLLQFAEGDIAPVFNKFPSGEHPPWELIDTYPKCCRLPQREYLLCSRVTKMDATTNKFEPCSMTTEYDLPYDGELSEGGQVPWAVLVESGQCDLMLISYLGIDFQNKGVRAYRLLDTTLTFYGVAQEGQTLCYDISIQSFAKQEGKVTMFFFSYNCYVDGKLLIEMRNGVAGFFTEAELDAGKGVVWTDGERAARAKAAANPKDPTPFLINPASKTYFSEVDMRTLSEKGHHDGTWGAVVGPSAASVKYKLCARKMLMIDRITHIIPRGGIHGLGMLIGEKILERDHWYFPCHFKNDQVMAGSLVSDGCSQLLKLYMIWMGLHTAVDGIVFTPVHKQANKVRCRGQISPHKGKLVYWVEINEIGFNTATGYPYAKADVNILDINFEKGETFDYPDNDSLLAALEAYGKGDMKRKIVVDFRGVALQIEGSPTSQHPNHRCSAPAARSSVVSGYDVGGLHLSGGFRSPLPPTKFMKWGGPTAGGHELSWHPMAGRDGNPTPGFRATAYPPRPICFLPFPGNPNDTNHTPGELPLSWVNMCEFMCNNLSACLGEEYKGFDESTSSRSPAFDLALTTRVLSVTGMVQEKGSTKWYGVDCDPSTGTMVAEFDCPSDAWFFVGAPRDDLMPYSILMEIALQTCGILTSWNKAPLTLAITHGYNLLFRNLDATATLIANVDLRGKTIVNTSKCTGYSMLGQMGVQKFNTVLQVDGQPFYEVDSSFGWFLPSVFEKQIGLDAGEKRECWHVLAGHAVQRYSLPDEEGHLFNEASLGSHTLQRRSNQVRFLDSVAFSATGGMHKQGYGHGCKKVDQRDWFFSCHFWCDPVMPGSLGIEAMHQTLELLCVKNGLTAGVRQPTFAHDLGKTTWKYRGQLTPKNDQCDVEVHVKSVVRANGCVTVVADGFLYVDHLRVYQANGLRLRIEPGAASFARPSPPICAPSHASHVYAADDASLRRALLEVESDICVSLPNGAGERIVNRVALDALGSHSKEFMDFYGVKYPMYTGAMAKGIASADLVVAGGKKGMLCSLGAGGLPIHVVSKALDQIQAELPNGPYAVNLIHSPFDETLEKGNVDLFLSRGVRIVEASAFMKVTANVVRYRVAGLERCPVSGRTICRNKLIWKVSRTELAEMALRPPPADFVQKLLEQGLITTAQAELAKTVPMADDVAVEADSGGHTDNRPMPVLLPVILATRDTIAKETGVRVRVGAGGGIGCPEAAAAAFAMGADFVVTGTINQMCRQAGTCDTVRKQLSEASYSDITMAPAADMFDQGVHLQVLKKGTMFPARAKTLYDLFLKYPSLEALPETIRNKLEKTVFRCPISEVWQDTVRFHIEQLKDPDKIEKAEADPKLKMSLCFRWYLSKSSGWANKGISERALDYQVWCGPAIGSFNNFIRGTHLDPAISRTFPDVWEANVHILRGVQFMHRCAQIRAEPDLCAVVCPSTLAAYVPEPVTASPASTPSPLRMTRYSPFVLSHSAKVNISDTEELRHALLEVKRDVLVSLPNGAGERIVNRVALDALGSHSKEFMDFYGVKYPMYTGAMAKGIASADLVVAGGKKGMLCSLGAGGLPIHVVSKALDQIQAELPNGPYAVNLIHSPFDETLEKGNVDLFLSRGVRIVEASAFMKVTANVVRYRVAGLERCPVSGRTICRNKLIWKVSRTELAEMALRPPPADFVQKLLEQGLITTAQAELAKTVPMADDVAVEADSGGHTDNRPMPVLLPVILATRDTIAKETGVRVRVGAGGGIGCPEAAAAAFAMGADFVVTGTINQMCRQAGTCDTVRKQLSEASYSDITMAPAADMFDQGVHLQVLKKGTMFPARAKTLYDLFLKYPSLEALPETIRNKLEKTVFRCPISEVWQDTVRFHIEQLKDPDKIEKAEADPKLKMSLCFRWYLSKSSGWANKGVNERALDFQVWCGPAIGAFNRFIQGTHLDPTISHEYPDVWEANVQILRGVQVLRRCSQLRGDPAFQTFSKSAALAPYKPMQLGSDN